MIYASLDLVAMNDLSVSAAILQVVFPADYDCAGLSAPEGLSQAPDLLRFLIKDAFLRGYSWLETRGFHLQCARSLTPSHFERRFYTHSIALQEIASRDMKLQNVLMCGEESQRPLLKVTGFGHAKVTAAFSA